MKLCVILSCLFLSLGGSVIKAIAQTPSSEVQMGQFLGAKNTEHPEWFKESFLDFEEDITEAAEENKRLVVYFHQDGCPYCNKLVEHNFTDPTISQKVQEHFDLVALNLWGDREVVQVGGKLFTEKTLGEALNVKFTPTLIFFNEDKEVALRLDGYYPPKKFIQALNYVSGKKEKQLSYSDYILSVETSKTTGTLNQAEWLLKPPYDLSRLVGEKPIAVLFEEPECENCDLLHAKTFKDTFAPDLIDQFNIIQLNRWAETPVIKPDGSPTSAEKWAHELGLGYVPAIILFDETGTQVMEVSAMFRTFHILSAFDYVASGEFKSQPNFQRYLSERAEHIRANGVDVDIWRY